VERCTISNCGEFCVAAAGSNNTLRNNTIFGCGQGGIALFAGMPVSALVAGNSSVIGNHITNFSRIGRTYNPAVTVSGVGNYVGHNYMANAPHTAFTQGGVDNIFEYNYLEHGAPRAPSTLPDDPLLLPLLLLLPYSCCLCAFSLSLSRSLDCSLNHSVTYRLAVCFETSDASAFYVGRSWTQPGNVVRFNTL
jgi:parallel beta-helix repeat protein